MLSEIERSLLADLVDSYGLKAVVNELATICETRYQNHPKDDIESESKAVPWLHDGIYLRNFLLNRLTSGEGDAS